MKCSKSATNLLVEEQKGARINLSPNVYRHLETNVKRTTTLTKVRGRQRGKLNTTEEDFLPKTSHKQENYQQGRIRQTRTDNLLQTLKKGPMTAVPPGREPQAKVHRKTHRLPPQLRILNDQRTKRTERSVSQISKHSARVRSLERARFVPSLTI